MNTHEIELKFQVPAAARAAVEAALDGALRTRLQAVYFDTPDRRLAANGIAVRLRLEGTQWVQTAKAGDRHAMQRHEHNVPVAGAANAADAPPPALDLARHDESPTGALIRAALHGAPLVPLYRTDILRTHRTDAATGGSVELALDVGEIVADGRHLPVFELEIERVEGDATGVIDTARHWVQAHGLWLDVRTKAERGDRLARNEPLGTPVRGKPLPAGTAPAAQVAAALKHLLPNASEVAGGHFSPGHVHQARLALRRLRRALPGLPAGAASAALCQVATATERQLRSGGRACEALQAPAFTQLLLSLLPVPG